MRWTGLSAAFLWFAATVPVAMGQTAAPCREGLLIHWEAGKGDGAAESLRLTDGSGLENHGFLVGEASKETQPPALKFGERGGAILASKPIRPEHLTLEAVFRPDRTRGPLQLVVTTHPPAIRAPAEAVPGNSRQWFLQIRGEPQQDGYFGFLEFGIFGEDGQWHSVMSEARIAKTWHHVIGTFDGQRVRLILDGVEQTRLRPGQRGPAYVGRINQPPGGLIDLPAAGSNSLKNPNAFEGAIASVRIYGRALNEEEIAQNFANAQSLVPGLAKQMARAKPAKPPFKVVYSNDFTNTGIITPWHQKGEPFHPDHLRASVREAAGVDVHLLQPAHGAVPWWPSKVVPLADHHAWWASHYGIDPEKLPVPGVHRYILGGGDPFDDFIGACRSAGQAPFVSMRLNDTHHLHHADLPGNRQGIHSISRFYVEHPEWRLGAAGSGLDWSVPEVRQRMFALIEEICENYEIAGLELDFMRFPNFFKEATPTEQRIGIITEFVTQVRALLDRTARDGQHRWLCARVPCKLDMLAGIGIDLPELVDAGVEMLNLSASYFTFQAHDLAQIRRLTPDAALYLEMCHCTMTGRQLTATGGDNFLFLRTTAQQYATTAHVAYRRGADGVSLFNFVYYRDHGVPGRGPFHEPPFDVLPHLGDPGWLARQPQWYFLAENWFTSASGALPARFEQGDARTFQLDMAPTGHQTQDGIFRILTAEAAGNRRWMAKVNGTTLEPMEPVQKPLPHPYESGMGEDPEYLCFRCPRRLVRDGINKIALILESGAPATVRYWDLVLP